MEHFTNSNCEIVFEMLAIQNRSTAATTCTLFEIRNPIRNYDLIPY